jgi:2-aminoethylphosphonate-pyruvate transaminase
LLKDGVHYLCSSANKNIQAMAGVSFVICRADALARLDPAKSRSYYLNLRAQHDYFRKTGQMRFTPPVQTIYALEQALTELETETVAGRYRRYSDMWRVLVQGLNESRLKRLVADENHGRLITAIEEPDLPGYSFERLHDFMKQQNFTIYPGKLGSQTTFRIANIGAIDVADMAEFVRLLKQFMVASRP